MLARMLLDELRETHQAVQEALTSCAQPSAAGLSYLRELRASAAKQGALVEALATERGMSDDSR
jgi:hypothetical protein